MREIVFDGTLAGWRRAARSALTAGEAPSEVCWADGQSSQGELRLGEAAAVYEAPAPVAPAGGGFTVPRAFLELAGEVSCHRDPARWALLYRALWRLCHGEPHLLETATDPDTHELQAMAKAVHRDLHKMRAFVRFREVATPEGPWFVAWFEPQHLIVEHNAAFFRDRFAAMRWSILTPDRCVHWDLKELAFTEGVAREAAPADDAMDDLWRTYYRSTFNPARLSVGAMTSQMPRHYWKNLPEAEIIPELVAAARPRMETMVARSEAAVVPGEFSAVPLPAARDIESLRRAAAGCRACPLWRSATCTVFGTGPVGARIVVVGEQPGDQEDLQGTPFVGPAGLLLNRALAAAGIDRGTLYLTNAVKHFKWEPRGKRRLHQKPTAREVRACRPWLEAELAAVRPDLIVCLGATAAQSVLERPVSIMAERGQRVPTGFGVPALLTVHPSALLRLPAGEDPERAFAAFVGDLRGMRAV